MPRVQARDSGRAALRCGTLGQQAELEGIRMTISDAGRTIFFRYRFTILFLLLVCVMLIPPFFEDAVWIAAFWDGLFTLILLWTLYTVAGRQKVLVLAVLILIPTVASTWLAQPGEGRYLVYIDNISNIIYFGLICVFMGEYILTARRVTLEVIFAAMCLYMIIAVLWAAIFANIEIFYDTAFTYNGRVAAEAGVNDENIFRIMVYYSFVTLSTLGYGDIVPVTFVSKNWAAMEAMVGQFFIAVIIARLVSVYSVEKDAEQVAERKAESLG